MTVSQASAPWKKRVFLSFIVFRLGETVCLDRINTIGSAFWCASTLKKHVVRGLVENK